MTTATVETLTAAVSVLTMGSRQITLGVYRQLDRAGHGDVEPMGRIRDPQDKALWNELHLIGRHRTTGALVRTALEWPELRRPVADVPEAFRHWISHTHPAANTHGYWTIADNDDPAYRLEWQTSHYYCRAESPEAAARFENRQWADPATDKAEREAKARGDYCDLEALRTEWQQQAAEETEWLTGQIKAYRAAKALPLIVLASR